MKALKIFILFILLLSFKPKAQVNGLNFCDQAPELNYWNKDSTKQIALSSLRGKIVLVNFWASWCGPCFFENPYLISTYKKYNNIKLGVANGFEIYSVSLDYKRTNWVDAIIHDSLYWNNHVSDLNGWNSKPALTYSINAIPDNYLLDENGIIIGRGFRGYDGKLDSVLNVLSNNSTDTSTLNTPPVLLQIYPNPTRTIINLKISQIDNFKMEDIKIYNGRGTCVQEQTISSSNLQTADSTKIYKTKAYCIQSQTIKLTNCQIDVGNLSEGIYTININSNEGIINNRFIIIK